MRHIYFHITCLLAVALLAVGCTESSSDDDGFDESSHSPSPVFLNEQSLHATSDGNGFAAFSFSITNEAAFQLLVAPGSNQAKLVELRNSQGPISLVPLTHTFRGPQNPTSVNVLEYPFGLLNVASGTYTATYQFLNSTGDASVPFTNFDATLLSKRDNDLNSGTVGVNMVLVGPVAGSQETRDSLQSALTVASSYLSSADLSLNVEWVSYPGSDLLPDPNSGDTFYEDISKATRPNCINLVFGSDVQGLQSQNSVYSISTGDGGPALPSTRSVAVLSILATAGGDGRFNFDGDENQEIHSDEIRLAGEEIAQLIAHYLGLSHILENDGNITKSSDALTDTHTCLTAVDCREEKDVRENLMFPFPLPILDDALDTYTRSNITAQQKAVLQRSVLVN
jgi:hypothetical protein